MIDRDDGRTEFEIGHRFEALDRHYPGFRCVASVVETRGSGDEQWVMVWFDGWEHTFDYWCRWDCPDIAPCGTCCALDLKMEKPGTKANSVKKRNGDEVPSAHTAFNGWTQYLELIGYEAAPARCFASEDPSRFFRGHEMEVAVPPDVSTLEQWEQRMFGCQLVPRVAKARVDEARPAAENDRQVHILLLPSFPLDRPGGELGLSKNMRLTAVGGTELGVKGELELTDDDTRASTPLRELATAAFAAASPPFTVAVWVEPQGAADGYTHGE